MITRKIFSLAGVLKYTYAELIWSTVLAVLVYALYVGAGVKVFLPFSIAAILGSGLAIFVAFRNNSAYGRWWEARTLWGGIVNSSRVLARIIISFADSHAHQAQYNSVRSAAFKQSMVYRCIAWVHALRLHLRGQDTWEVLQPLLPLNEYTELLASQNKPNYLQLLMGKHIYEAMADGTLGGFDSFQMEGQLLALANYQGGCERIKNTPLLRQYHFFTKLFSLVFMLVLPFSLVADFDKAGLVFLLIPVSVLVSFVFGVMARVGEVNEDPFENQITDVPLTALCITIERDLREMLGEPQLPPKAKPENGAVF
jgi:putative membrane protein